MKSISGIPQRTLTSRAVSFALVSLVAGGAAMAQDSKAPSSAAAGKETGAREGEVQRVEIVATRRSQQSSIDRKKNAATAIDSIVAEDVGSLPDRNVGEAISRMAGVTLDRGDYGEGISVGVRGNGSDLTRVELDGQAVQSAGGSDMNGGGDGRGSEFRQLSADLIKSVDIIKGQTADMNEGSLGGGIRIETRNGLDFKKPFVSVRTSGTQSSLNKKWTPDLNLILSKKFFDDRVGLLLNASSTKMDNESHQFQTSANGRDGYARFFDLDNSPEKTFSFQPNTLDMENPASSTPVNTYSANGRPVYVGPTPLELLNASAAARTKADCFAAFPQLTTGSASLAALSSANRANAVNSRRGELLTCLNQWNDYAPPLLRHFVKRQIDERRNLDLRADFKINRDFTVYAKGAYSKREVDDNFMTFALGQIGVNGNVNGVPAYTDVNGVRTANPNSGWYTLPNTWSAGASGTGAVQGATVNFDPATAVVDSTHHVVKASLNNGGVSTDQIRNLMETSSRYLQFGGKFQRESLSGEFLVGDARSDFRRANLRTSLSYDYGPATVALGPNGTWGYTFPTAPQLDNPANYVTPLAGSGTGTSPVITRDRVIQWQSPLMRETSERTAKADLAWALPEAVPFFTRLKGGFNLRDTKADTWDDGGYTVSTAVGTAGTPGYRPAITLPNNNVRATLRGCENTPASGAGANACKYGYTLGAAPSLSGTYIMPFQQFRDVLGQVITQPATETRLFQGADGRPSDMIDNFRQVDVLKLINLLGLPNFDYHCMKECVGSDGKLYAQPLARVGERTEALYLMADFSLDRIPFTNRALPFGWEIDGNLGYRYVRTKVKGVGSMTFRTIRKTAAYNPLDPDAAAGIVTYEATRNTELNAKNHEFMPSYNLAMWLVPDKLVLRYNAAKSVARPPVSRLLAAGSCTYDERNIDNTIVGDEDEGNLGCTTVGNPNLRGRSNFNQNVSVEWYPNRDTMFTAAFYKQDGRVGAFKTEKLFGVPVFAGTDAVDPETGAPLADVLFDYNTYINGPVSRRTGIELSSRTAFTFLPSVLRYTGVDANVSRNRSKVERPLMDPITGQALPPVGEPKYSHNIALWYDDGRLTARVAMQTVGPIFRGIAPQGDTGTNLNTYPIFGFSNSSTLPWNPGSPNWRERRSFIDGKIAYKIRPNIEVFVEGRNLTNTTQTDLIGSAPYADGTPNLQNYAFAGRRITVGVNFRN